MALQAGSIRNVANTGILGIGSMLQSVTQSAKTLVQDTFIIITNQHILEIKCNKFLTHKAMVVFSLPISFLSKLKFRRQESVSFFFKEAPEDPVIYMCNNSSQVVKHMQTILKQQGVHGKHTNAALARSVQQALDMIADIQLKEQQLEQEPTLLRVQEIMDLFRQAAEIFNFADDPRHEEVLQLLHKFIAKPLVAHILEGSSQPSSNDYTHTLQIPSDNQELIDTSTITVADTPQQPSQNSHIADEDFHKSIMEAEEMLRMANQDLTHLEEPFDSLSTQSNNQQHNLSHTTSSHADTMAELEDMLKQVDSELEELIQS
jgi:hypothetical protein